MNGLDLAKCQNQDEGTRWEFLQRLMRIKTKANSVDLLHFESQKRARGAVGVGFVILERERAHSL